MTTDERRAAIDASICRPRSIATSTPVSRISRFHGSAAVASPAKRRSSRKSSAHCSSGGCSARMRRRSAPVPRRAGAIVATTRPRRTTVNVSPRCSTASKRSAKRFDASVALISLTSDYPIRGRQAQDLQGGRCFRSAGSPPAKKAGCPTKNAVAGAEMRH